MKPLTGAIVFIGLTSAIAIACGDSKPEAKAPDSPQAPATDSAPDAPQPPSASVTPPPAPTDSAAVAAAVDAGAAPAKPANGVVVGETKDDCTPVGVDFEKRARPKLKDCYGEGKKKDPNLMGTVKIKVTVDLKGKIKKTEITEKTLPDPVAQCMLKVVKTTPFPEVNKCWDSTLTIPITFPTPR